MTRVIPQYVCAVAGVAGASFIWFATQLLHFEHEIVLARTLNGKTWWLRWDALAILLLLYVIFRVIAWKTDVSAPVRERWRTTFVFGLLVLGFLSFQPGISDCLPGWPCSHTLNTARDLHNSSCVLASADSSFRIVSPI